MLIDWNSVRDEVVGHLQALLRIDTVNPPGNETAAAAYLADVARAAGIPHEFVGGVPGRDNFVARLRANGGSGGSGGSSAGRPVILLGHTDVVGVERGRSPASRCTASCRRAPIRTSSIWRTATTSGRTSTTCSSRRAASTAS